MINGICGIDLAGPLDLIWNLMAVTRACGEDAWDPGLEAGRPFGPQDCGFAFLSVIIATRSPCGFLSEIRLELTPSLKRER